MDPNIDTDIIFPARFLLLIDREDMKPCFFRDRRYRADDTLNPDFPMNQEGLRDVGILIAGPGFGCGSSREQAVWTIVDNGVRVIVGTDFGDIFSGNAEKNGLLLIRVSPEERDALARLAGSGAVFSVDVPEGRLTVEGADPVDFHLSAQTREMLVNGWNEMDLILNTEAEAITAFEDLHRTAHPWLFDRGMGVPSVDRT